MYVEIVGSLHLVVELLIVDRTSGISDSRTDDNNNNIYLKAQYPIYIKYEFSGLQNAACTIFFNMTIIK